LIKSNPQGVAVAGSVDTAGNVITPHEEIEKQLANMKRGSGDQAVRLVRDALHAAFSEATASCAAVLAAISAQHHACRPNVTCASGNSVNRCLVIDHTRTDCAVNMGRPYELKDFFSLISTMSIAASLSVAAPALADDNRDLGLGGILVTITIMTGTIMRATIMAATITAASHRGWC
jgi:hypothetical protein